MQAHKDVISVQQEISAIFNRHNDVSFAIMKKYPVRRSEDGCDETAPLSQEDNDSFIESRRFLMEALRVELPKIMKKHPAIFNRTLSSHQFNGDPYAYGAVPLHFSPQDKCLAVMLSFAPGEKTTIHDHGVACVSYLAQGEMMEAECNAQGQPIRTKAKRMGETTIVSPHEEAAEFNKHMLFSSGTHPQSLLVHVYDCLALTPDGRIKDLTQNTKTLQNSILSNIIIPPKGGMLMLRK
ncbi:MAG: hypothetical protein EBV03_05245 [Proteobacteria bacterium]|nr:hypothetical protein [Pseudomonadota bacterium]